MGPRGAGGRQGGRRRYRRHGRRFPGCAARSGGDRRRVGHQGPRPGTIYRVPGEEPTDLPPLQGCTPTFRWDHAIPFARWASARPAHRHHGVPSSRLPTWRWGELSEPVTTAMEQVIELIERDFLAAAPADRRGCHRGVHRRGLPADGCVVGGEQVSPDAVAAAPVGRTRLWHRPLRGPSSGVCCSSNAIRRGPRRADPRGARRRFPCRHLCGMLGR